MTLKYRLKGSMDSRGKYSGHQEQQQMQRPGGMFNMFLKQQEILVGKRSVRTKFGPRGIGWPDRADPERSNKDLYVTTKG